MTENTRKNLILLIKIVCVLFLMGISILVFSQFFIIGKTTDKIKQQDDAYEQLLDDEKIYEDILKNEDEYVDDAYKDNDYKQKDEVIYQ